MKSMSLLTTDLFWLIQCPHPRCGRRYQARIGLTRHLVKYHGENVEKEEVGALKPKSDLTLQTAVGTGVACSEEASHSRSPLSGSLNTTPAASVGPSCSSSSSSSCRPCFSVKTVRVRFNMRSWFMALTILSNLIRPLSSDDARSYFFG